MMSQQWPQHQRKMYNDFKNKNYQIRQEMTPDQHVQEDAMYSVHAEIYTNMLKQTDYPDDLAYEMADFSVLKMISEGNIYENH